MPAAGLAALLVGHPRGPPCPVGRAPEAHPTDPGRGAPAFLGGCPSRLPGLAAGGAPAAPRSPGARLLVGSSGRPSFAARRLPWAAAALVAKPLGEAAPDGGPAHGLRQLVVLLPGGFPPLLSRVPASSCRGRPPPPPPRAGLPTVPRPMAGRCFPRPPGREPCPLQSEMAPADLSELWGFQQCYVLDFPNLADGPSPGPLADLPRTAPRTALLPCLCRGPGGCRRRGMVPCRGSD